jgi:hypothetical protein
METLRHDTGKRNLWSWIIGALLAILAIWGIAEFVDNDRAVDEDLTGEVDNNITTPPVGD